MLFFNGTETTENYTYLLTLSLHAALPVEDLPMAPQTLGGRRIWLAASQPCEGSRVLVSPFPPAVQSCPRKLLHGHFQPAKLRQERRAVVRKQRCRAESPGGPDPDPDQRDPGRCRFQPDPGRDAAPPSGTPGQGVAERTPPEPTNKN